MSIEIRTPVNHTPAVELGNKIWRKQVLPANKTIRYGDRDIAFDETYCRNVADAYSRRAFDTVPFVLAPENNSHTMAAERGQYGEVVAAEVDMDAVNPETGEPAPGLYYNLRLSDEAEQIVSANPKFGVSVRVKEQYDRADGQHFDAACQHLLGTWDPVLTGMSPWQPLDVTLSNSPGTAVIDLSALTFERPPTPAPAQTSTSEEEHMTTPTTTGPSEDVLAAVRQVLREAGLQLPDQPAADTTTPPAQRDAAAPTPDAVTVTVDDEGEEMSDADWEAFSASVLADVDAGGEGEGGDQDDTDDDSTDEGEGGAEGGDDSASTEVQASATGGSAVELAQRAATNDRMAALELSNRRLQAGMDAANYKEERDRLCREHGIPPHIVDLARPLLEGSGRTVTLSNGQDTADAGEIARKMLAEFGKVAQLLDLSSPTGSGLLVADDGEQEAAQARTARAQTISGQMGLLAG